MLVDKGDAQPFIVVKGGQADSGHGQASCRDGDSAGGKPIGAVGAVVVDVRGATPGADRAAAAADGFRGTTLQGLLFLLCPGGRWQLETTRQRQGSLEGKLATTTCTSAAFCASCLLGEGRSAKVRRGLFSMVARSPPAAPRAAALVSQSRHERLHCCDEGWRCPNRPGRRLGQRGGERERRGKGRRLFRHGHHWRGCCLCCPSEWGVRGGGGTEHRWRPRGPCGGGRGGGSGGRGGGTSGAGRGGGGGGLGGSDWFRGRGRPDFRGASRRGGGRAARGCRGCC
mmetsp:Transcript_99882/g.322010  ORF Transcript_99882/g.322010 Transcript_99882/m.322010 type:complete len:284 (+) Transcript_99882:608-1459(+)